MPTISFSNADTKASITQRTRLKAFITKLFYEEGKGLKSLQYVFCSDDYLLNINQQFLHHDTYTDIVTFDLSENAEDTIGEIYISVDRVKENSIALSVPFLTELYRVMFHGALHLCGFKDKKKSEKEEMRYKEDYYLRLYSQSKLE